MAGRRLLLFGGSGAAEPRGLPGPAGLAQVNAIYVSAPTQISITEVDGEILFLMITQDATGHAVTWDAMFLYPPSVPGGADLVTTALFVGVSGKWVNTGIIGRHS